MPVNFNITNQLASPAIYASSFATRPAPSFIGRLFVDTDNPSTGIYRDTGTVWVAVAGSAAEAQSLQNVCQIGNTTTTGVLITGQSAFGTQGGDPIGPIGDYTVSIGETSLISPNNSLICQHNALFETNVFINTSLTTPLLIGGDTTTSTLTYKTTSAAGITGANHLFVVGNNGATEAMRILNNANVLIGTTTDAGFKLDVNGTARVGALSGTSATFSATSTFNGASTGVIAFFNAPTSGGTITFQTGGTSFADIGSELGNFGTGSATNLCVSARSGKDIILGGGASKTLILASTGAATFSNTLYIGASSVNASAQLQADSTTKGFLPPRMTTTQINAIATPAEGLIAYNTTLSHLCVYQAAAWAKLSHSPM